MEIWKEIEGFNGAYKVSNLGNIYSKHLNSNKKQTVGSHGYYSVSLYIDNIKNDFLVHRLVAKYFVENSLNKNVVNHKDYNKLNNNFLNLEWVTHYENSLHSNLREINHYKRKVLKLDKLSNDILAEYNSLTEAAYSVSLPISNICRCLKGLRKKAGGFKWRYG